ncbi:Conserved oligomeric Golgi complex subunit 6 [Echinococcus granulosus]|uniref:Conserved oligomeric Golgi complex subunit 6 n=2 Tax=Echinococcus granulosus TaxID=6210 RepID=W6ULS9_ECHGR|nr:Conserved oligomeric Golgi complex subunit 6 [Echinococcus granulosus]EUB62008.1 Conserved oligomeric Golgi complex subunit 6 [Echinococcus granulosus]
MQIEPSFDSKNPLGGRISKIIGFTAQADESFFESLQVLSESYTCNDARSRRNLRSVIEKSRLDLAEGFLREMSAIKTGLDSLSAELNTMSNTCLRINERLMSSKSRMEELINQTNVNQAKRNSVTLTHLAANAILGAFYISQEDWALLDEQTDDKSSENLLTKLQRARGIRQLIINTLGVPNLPLLKDLLDSSTTYIDEAFERLYQWIKREVSAQNFEAVEISVPFRKCLRELQERPIFFKYILDEYANARRQLIVETFLHALTVGWNSGGNVTSVFLSKPIEMQSHDPTRYAGDMLAWLHQAVASEKEYLCSLTSEKADKEIVCDCLSNITGGLAHPLQLRLEQILVTEHDAVLLYQINNLLQFYANVILNLLDERATLYTTLSELQSLSWNLFVSALQRQTSDLLADSEPPRHDLTPSMSTIDVTRLLEAILATQDMSCAPPDVRQTKCEEVVAVVVKPLLEHYELTARALISPQEIRKVELEAAEGDRELPPVALVYLLNSLHSLQGTLARLAFTGPQIATVVERLEAALTDLTHSQAAYILSRAGLYRLYEALNAPQESEGEEVPLAQRGAPGCSQDEIIDALREFNTEYLSGPDAWGLPEAAQIAFSRPRNALRRRTADLVQSLYTRLYEAITDSKSGYSNPWPEDLKTPEQVAGLLLPSSSAAIS